MQQNSGPLSDDEVGVLNLAHVGRNVSIDRSVRLFGADRISVGDNTRIDCNCVLSAGQGGIVIGAHCHLAVGVVILGAGAVIIEDYAGVSAGVSIFSSTDDYSGGAMTNPTIPDEFRAVIARPVTLRKHALIGATSVIMPGVEIGIGASVGALSFVNKSVPEFCVVSGNPMRKVGMRDRSLLTREAEFEIKFRP